MGKQYQERTLEACIQKAMLLEKSNVPNNLLIYDLMLNLPTDNIDVDLETDRAQERLKEELSAEERKYIEAKLYVLNLMKMMFLNKIR